MQTLIAETKLRHNGKWLTPGAQFQANDQDADDLVAMRMARKAPLVTRAVEAVKETASAMSAATRESSNGTRPNLGRRQQYSRRDLQAEGTNSGDEK